MKPPPTEAAYRCRECGTPWIVFCVKPAARVCCRFCGGSRGEADQVSGRPWDMDQARAACRRASEQQEAAEQTLKQLVRAYAEAERAYRRALSVAETRLHAEGVAWSVVSDLARGDEHVSTLKYERDIAKGMQEAQQHSLWRHNANRKDAQRFADWSQRREFAEAAGSFEPTYEQPIGARS